MIALTVTALFAAALQLRNLPEGMRIGFYLQESSQTFICGV